MASSFWFLLALALTSAAYCEVAVPADQLSNGGSAIPDQAWAYVNVRPDAYMFWWLYGCNNSRLVREDRPLAMWLQVG